MSEKRPTGTRFGMTYSFAKTFVHNLEAMAQFYERVLGLERVFCHQDTMFGRPIDEIGFQASYPGGPALTLIKYLDSSGPVTGEAVQGFLTNDIEAVIERAKANGGTVGEPGIFRVEEYGLSCVFVLDPEGHIIEVVQLDHPPA